MSEHRRYSGGANIALKLPKDRYDQTVSFYRDVLGFALTPVDNPARPVSVSYRLSFGPITLWLDCVDRYPQAQVWLELQTAEPHAAVKDLVSHGARLVDELEDLPDGMHWIKDPSGTVLLLNRADTD